MLLILSALVGLGSSQRALGKYNVDQSKISVSGISSGAAMATQMHVAYSSVFSGVGLVAGNPYWCAQGSTIAATGTCMTKPQNIVVGELTTQTTRYASSGDIDPTNNMYNDRVFILGGTLDTAVVQGVGRRLRNIIVITSTRPTLRQSTTCLPNTHSRQLTTAMHAPTRAVPTSAAATTTALTKC